MNNPENSNFEGLLVHLEYLSGLYPDLPVGRFLTSSFPHVPDKAPPASILVPSLSLFPQGESIEPLSEVSYQYEERDTRLATLSGQVSSCRLCPLGDSRINPVFGEGDPRARLMFIGEGPGAEEDRTGRPFVGRAGELLSKMIAAMGLDRNQVYIANAVKCRPPGNRTPEPFEREMCRPFLLEQINIISPEAIVLLGQTAIFSMLSKDSPLSSFRGVESVIVGFPEVRVMPTYHPAYLLRNPQAKSLVWKDLQEVMSWLSLPMGTSGQK